MAANRHQVLEIGLLNYLWPALTIYFLSSAPQEREFHPRPRTLLALSGSFLF